MSVTILEAARRPLPRAIDLIMHHVGSGDYMLLGRLDDVLSIKYPGAAYALIDIFVRQELMPGLDIYKGDSFSEMLRLQGGGDASFNNLSMVLQPDGTLAATEAIQNSSIEIEGVIYVILGSFYLY
jgi:hypothetical protein